jgi:hypothetical protein
MGDNNVTREDVNYVLEKLAEGVEKHFCSSLLGKFSVTSSMIGGAIAKIFRGAKLPDKKE